MGALRGDGLMGLENVQGLEAADVAAVGGGDGGRLEKILVSVRLRPLNPKEIAANDVCNWECINDASIISSNSLGERSMAPTSYTFDKVFKAECTTKEVYEQGAKEVALSVVSGINSTVFAYGQTSSGKTYTMTGITEYTVADIYDYIKRHEEREFILKFSAIEIYNEVVRDLFSMDNTPLRVLDDPERGTVVEKLTEILLRDWNHLKELISVCEAQRRIGETLLNEMSSRSHQILRLTIESSAREFLGKDSSSTLAASVNFVDLAGSERASQALSVGNRLKEGCHINRSLLTLGTVIRKLSKGRNGHIPFRDSKLTRILQPSLGGNARTAIICTICPARSHIEQSRNTLLFASCAKEVVTSARVNVVMSDKDLVKHLQRELTKLEGELKNPRSSSITSNFEALLTEKDAQILKMEKEIRELIQQRDLAKTQLEDFLRVVGNGHRSSQSVESNQMSTPGLYKTYEDAFPISESSIAYRKFGSYGRDNKNENGEHNVHAPLNSIISRMLTESIPPQAEEIMRESDEDSEVYCKEVRCIEMDGPVKSGDTKSLIAKPNSNEQTDLIPYHPNSSYITLEQHLQYVRERLRNFVKASPEGSSPCSRSLVPSRSRSLREIIMRSSPPWLLEDEQSNSSPPCSSHKDYSGRTERFQRKCVALNYGDETATPSRDESQIFERNSCNSVFEGESVASVSKGGIGDIYDFVAGLKMSHVHCQNVCEDSATRESPMGVRLNPIIDSMESPSRWLLEFEKKQQAIIELWHACNVSLIHRTYFFLLFKGDPTDSVYMEVELRRLTFLKRTLTRENVAPASSMRRLRQEREMLFKHMQRRFSSEERKSLYKKWGIALDSRQRKWQLVRRLWTETRDLEHVRESVSMVAKLIGLSDEPGHSLKGMFGLSFAPENCSRRSFKWKKGASSFK